MSFPRYPRYKDSGVEWPGEVPEEWQILPNKAFLLKNNLTVGDEWKSLQLLSLTLHGVIDRDIDSGHGKYPSDFGLYQKVRVDNLVFCLFDIDETPRTVGLAKSDGMITSAYDVFESKPNADPDFVAYYYIHIDSFKGLRPFYTGLRKVVRPPTFLSLRVALPQLSEQQSIAVFLDRETAKIDALVAEQENLIALLKEKRQAVISHAVTKGLDPTVPMKDSGIEWLGEVPDESSIKPFKAAVDYQEGPGIMAVDFHEEGVPLLRVSSVQSRWASIEGCNYLDPDKVACQWKHFRLVKGAILST